MSCRSKAEVVSSSGRDFYAVEDIFKGFITKCSHGLRNWFLPHDLFALILGQSEAVVASFLTDQRWHPTYVSRSMLFSSCKPIYFRFFSLLSSLSAHPGTTYTFQPLKPNQNFCFKFWSPWLNLDWFGVSCLDAGCYSAPSLSYKAIWNSTIAVWCFSWESEKQKDATLWRSKWLSGSETPSLLVWKGFECDKWCFGSGRGWVGADANFILTIACLSLPESPGSTAQAKLPSQG